jgi:hypothetical protein
VAVIATPAGNAAALDGFCRKMLEEDRDAQIAAVARWLSGKDGTLH